MTNRNDATPSTSTGSVPPGLFDDETGRTRAWWFGIDNSRGGNASGQGHVRYSEIAPLRRGEVTFANDRPFSMCS